MICQASFALGFIAGFAAGAAIVGFSLLYWMFSINGPIN